MNHCQPYPGTQLCLSLSLWVRVIYATGRELNGVQESGSEVISGWGLFNRHFSVFFCTCLVTPVDCFLVCAGVDDKYERDEDSRAMQPGEAG